MLYILIVVVLLTIYLSIRLYIYKREVKRINRQLGLYNELKTGKKIDVTLLEKDIETLGSGINRLINRHVSEKGEKRRSENELKQAVANMSHDLRTPLTSIKGYIQMAADRNINDAEREEYMKVALDRAIRLEHLIDDFFELSKIESEDYHMNPEHFNLKQLINETILGFYTDFIGEDIEPKLEMPESQVSLYADIYAVTRVMENLISNALKYSDGKITIGVNEDDETISAFVKNSTSHIDGSDNLEMIFDRFYVADQSRRDKSAGLGLSIAKSLMEKMNGNISAEYEEGMLTIRCEWMKL